MQAGRFFRARFRAVGDPIRARGAKAYMKSELAFHGITQKQLRDACREFCSAEEAAHLDRAGIRRLACALFATRDFDLRSAAVGVLERKQALLDARDLPWLVELMRKAACWAHVDWLVTKVVGPILEREPGHLRETLRWAKDDSFWVRRAALLAQLRPLSRGGGDFPLFARIAVPMLGEKEFFIRKAIGWVLREVSKKRPEPVRAFLREHGEAASGLTRREATKYL
jgi:3-methyladenine DNA glycosylase AlkD